MIKILLFNLFTTDAFKNILISNYHFSIINFYQIFQIKKTSFSILHITLFSNKKSISQSLLSYFTSFYSSHSTSFLLINHIKTLNSKKSQTPSNQAKASKASNISETY